MTTLAKLPFSNLKVQRLQDCSSPVRPRSVASLQPRLALIVLLALCRAWIAPAASAQVSFAGAQSILPSTFGAASGIAVDSAGNVFVADYQQGQVVELPLTSTGYGTPTVLPFTGPIEPLGIAVGSSGEVFIADHKNMQVLELPRSGSGYGAQTILPFSAKDRPASVAVDGAGNVFIVDSATTQIQELARTATGYRPETVVPFTGVGAPADIAVDNAGDLFLADEGFAQVLELPQTTAGYGAQITLPFSGLSSPSGVAVDGNGNVFVAEGGGAAELPRTPSGYGTQITLDLGVADPTNVGVNNLGGLFLSGLFSQFVFEVQTGSVNFGSANVCPSGASAPAPCGTTQTLTYNIAAGTTVGGIKVLTLGTPELDFQARSGDASTTLCAPQTYASAAACTVDVTFAPLYSGARSGAVQVLDSGGNVLASTNIYGIGTAPAIGFNPAPQLSLVGGAGFAFGQPSGVAKDGSGNLFVSDFKNKAVYEMLAAGGYTTVKPLGGTPAFGGPAGVAVDGAGNVFVADFTNEAVYEILAAGGYKTVQTLGGGFAFGVPSDVALDSSGNLFVGDYGAVYEIPAAGGYTTVVRLASAFAFGQPSGLAVDNSGNVFVSDFGKNAVYEILAAGDYTTVHRLAGTFGFKDLLGVAVDASDNVFVADGDFSTIFEILAPGGYTTVLPLGSGFGAPQNVTVDANGDVYVPDGGLANTVAPAVQVIERSLPPALSFALTDIGSTSSDSPKPVQFGNIGNQTLSGTGTLSGQLDFGVVAGPEIVPDCNGVLSLAPGAGCNISLSFTPQSAGPLAAALTLSDNALNGNPAIQTVQLSGTGRVPGPLITGISPNYGAPAALITISGTDFGASQGAGSVTVGGAPSYVVSWSSTSIAIQVPSKATTGNIVVTAGGKASNGAAFTFYGFPAIAGFSPSGGAIGMPVTITGSNLFDGGGNAVVTFNGAQAAILSQSSTSIQVTVPAAASTGPLSVHVNGNTVKSAANFTLTGPQILRLSPNYGAPAALVNIAGNNFGATQGTSGVTVGGAPSYIVSWSNTLISIQVPSRATTGNIVVTVGGSASNGSPFTFYGFPAITGFSPGMGAAGTPVTITGVNLLDGGGSGAVTFNGTPAAILSQTSTSIQVEVPAGASTGQLSVRANGNTVKSAGSFAVPGPMISGISPDYGAPAAVIVITGSLFGATQGNGYVTIDGAVCGVTAWSNTSISIRVPSNASTGNVVVRSGGASNGVPFTFYASPTIGTVSPESGSVGAPVTITGTNLLDGGDNPIVTFNGTPAAIVNDSSGQIQVTVPAGATTGQLRVKINGVTVIAPANFTVLAGTVAVASVSSPLNTGASHTFMATVQNAASTAVNWSVVQPGGGSITPAGTYTAPALPGTYTVKAALQSDSLVAGTASVPVVIPEGHISGYDAGPDYHATGTDYAYTAFITTYNDPSVRDQVRTQLQGIADRGATVLGLRIWFVTEPGTSNYGLSWRATFPMTGQEQANLHAYAEDVAAIKGAGGNHLRMDIGLFWLGTADYTMGSPATGFGYIPISAATFTSRLEQTTDSVIAAISNVNHSDGTPVVDTVYMEGEVQIGAKANQEWFMTTHYPRFVSKVSTAGFHPAVYFIVADTQADVLQNDYVDADFPILNNHRSMFWVYRTIKFMVDNQLPVPPRIDFSYYVPSTGATYPDLLTRVLDDADATLPSLGAAQSYGIAETYYFADDTQRREHGQAFAAEAAARSRLHQVTFWTAPDGGGAGVDIAYPFAIEDYLPPPASEQNARLADFYR